VFAASCHLLEERSHASIEPRYPVAMPPLAVSRDAVEAPTVGESKSMEKPTARLAAWGTPKIETVPALVDAGPPRSGSASGAPTTATPPSMSTL
jgi:hypothetical protein